MTQPPIASLAQQLGDPVRPASFPETRIRFRNDRWAGQIGLNTLQDEDWIAHFGRFEPLPGNIETPLAMRYHGHQFHHYNPDLGDGRGFLFAQLQDTQGRWLDLGTKGSGQTPWSRRGDGRLTLKGGVREILAASYLEALGVKTSKAFSLIETGEALQRGDEPSPTRSSVLVRLSHSHLRFGTFQRLAYLGETETLEALVHHCLDHYFPGGHGLATDKAALYLFEQMIGETARMIGQWMPTGFVHGVMNTDNFNITGETFDFGPWRFLETSDPNFVAAYFDDHGLYRFGRQPTQGLWALQQLGGALAELCEADVLSAVLQRYEALFQEAFSAHTHKLLGLEPLGDLQKDLEFIQYFFTWLTDTQTNWPGAFYDWFCGSESSARALEGPRAPLYKDADFDPVRAAFETRMSARPERLAHPYFQGGEPVSLLIDEVEALWVPIAERDDWGLFDQKLEHIEAARAAYGIAFEAS